MPYIKPEDRSRIDAGEIPTSAGELNYAITLLCDAYLIDNKARGYAAINDVIGVLECCKLEMYQVQAVPYEQVKMKENGEAMLWRADGSHKGA